MDESNLLIRGDCPYGYRCKAMDCMECMKIRHGEKEK